MEITRNGSESSKQAPEEWFTGSVRIENLFEPNDYSRAKVLNVTFEPGARTAWHTHPLGQRLIITYGCGWIQREGGPIEVVNTGDLVWFEPNEKHWHGASPETAMMHIAIQEEYEGRSIDWLEKVSDEEYQKS